MPPEFTDFEGAWALSRQITDDQAGPNGLFEGRAWFVKDKGGLAYHERGRLTLTGQAPFTAERRYHWQDGGQDVVVTFADGRFFHRFNRAAPSATHRCDPDTYIVRYDFDSWPRWQSTWRVTGPRKAYKMVNTYHPIDR